MKSAALGLAEGSGAKLLLNKKVKTPLSSWPGSVIASSYCLNTSLDDVNIGSPSHFRGVWASPAPRRVVGEEKEGV